MENAIYSVYATFDRGANRYGQIVVDMSDYVAKRNFLYAVSQSSQLQYIAKDMELHRIAQIDLVSGDVAPVIPHEMVCRGSEAINDT